MVGGLILNFSGDGVVAKAEVGKILFWPKNNVFGQWCQRSSHGFTMVQFYSEWFPNDHIKMLNKNIRGLTNENPIEFGQELNKEDDSLIISTVGLKESSLTLIRNPINIIQNFLTWIISKKSWNFLVLSCFSLSVMKDWGCNY